MKRALPLLSAILLSACASRERVILLPSADGRPSAVVVSKDGQQVVLETPFSGAEITSGQVAEKTYTAAQVQRRYGELLAGQPRRAQSIDLYFSQGDTLTAESQAQLAQLRQRIAELPAAEVIVIGHTDTLGSSAGNDKLSQARADTVRDALIAAGVPADKIETVGRGEREPRIPTPDETAEPRNRRVEIKVR